MDENIKELEGNPEIMDSKASKRKERFIFKLWLTLPLLFVLFIGLIFGVGYLSGLIKKSDTGVVTSITEDTVSAAGVIAGKMEEAYDKQVVGTEGELKVEITELNIEKIFEINQLSTSEFSYGAIYTQYDEKGEKVDYYAAYEGTVKIGIDFSKITVEIDEEEKKVYINTPKCKVQDVQVEVTDFIFVNEKAETETVVVEAYNLCKDELKDRAKNDSKLMKMSEKNTISAITALTEPFIEQVDDEYVVEVRYGEVNK